jgi:hypothetical protein
MLKSLALHVASLRSRATEGPSHVNMLTDRVRALCEEIAKQTSHREDEIATQLRTT